MLNDFLKQLRSLPYADMMLVAKELNAMLGGAALLDTSVLAEALAALSQKKLPGSAEGEAERKLIQRLFRRNRSILIKQEGSGWCVSISTLGAAVRHTDLKVALEQLIDTITVAEALRG